MENRSNPALSEQLEFLAEQWLRTHPRRMQALQPAPPASSRHYERKSRAASNCTGPRLRREGGHDGRPTPPLYRLATERGPGGEATYPSPKRMAPLLMERGHSVVSAAIPCRGAVWLAD